MYYCLPHIVIEVIPMLYILKGSVTHTRNILELFDLISQLNGTRHRMGDSVELYDRLVKILVHKSGLFPYTECTTALHELIHIAQQTALTGPPRYSNLFKFERANHYLKQLLQNSNQGLASIFKNYLVTEHMAIVVGTSFKNMANLSHVFSSLPTDLNIFAHGASQHVSSLHVDFEEDQAIVYTVETSRINELRGKAYRDKELSGTQFIKFLEFVGEECTEGCLLDILFIEYRRLKDTAQRGSYRNFSVVVHEYLEDPDAYSGLMEPISDSPEYTDDHNFLMHAMTDMKYMVER
jgi:hypothetical protein